MRLRLVGDEKIEFDLDENFISFKSKIKESFNIPNEFRWIYSKKINGKEIAIRFSDIRYYEEF